MPNCNLRYTEYGDLIIDYKDDPHKIVDAMLETGYSEEFCIAIDFRPDFIAGLMEAGFLVMSMELLLPGEKPKYVLLPKLHLLRSALFFENLHIKKSVRRYLDQYELRFDSDFESIVKRCLEIHGDGWLTPPLVDAIKVIRKMSDTEKNNAANNGTSHNAVADGAVVCKPCKVRPVSFALYRDGKLVAGEFGIRAGRVYTSYSGYYDESNAGTVQLIKTTEYLRDNGFDFLI